LVCAIVLLHVGSLIQIAIGIYISW
jgi:hypothetical protein